VELPPGLARGANRRAKGEDIARGDAALTRAVIWSHGTLRSRPRLACRTWRYLRRPRVAVFSTGNELREPGTPLAPTAIYDSNRFALTALLRRSGCEVTDLGILQDDRDAMQASLSAATQAHDLVHHVRRCVGRRGRPRTGGDRRKRLNRVLRLASSRAGRSPWAS